MSAAPLEPAPAWQADLARWQRLALVAGGAGLAGCVLGVGLGYQEQFFRSYLVAFNLFLGVALGCLAVLMLQHLTGGDWGFILRRPLEAATRTLPLLALLFVPLALGLSDLYAWADPASPKVQGDEHLKKQVDHLSPFLNVGFFLARAAAYFAVWVGLALLLSAWSRRYDETGDVAVSERMRRSSAPGLVLYGLTVTFASIDWVMSLEPLWYSTIYGALFGIGQVLSGFTFAVAALLLLGTRPPLDRVLSASNLRDLGSLLLAFVMVWAYLEFSQFLLIWSGNLKEEIPWYLARMQGGWGYVGLALVVFYFALPFALLLSGDLKRSRGRLLGVAFLVLAMRVVDLFWLIVPAYQTPGREPVGLGVHPLDVAALVGVGGLWLGVFLWQVRQRPLLPLHAPPAEEGNHHG
jgi:hypothetical protein